MADSPSIDALLAHTRWVEELARSLVRDPGAADDLSQATLLAALKSGAAVEEPRPWLARILRRQRIEAHRRDETRRFVERDVARAERLPGPDELAERAERERRVVGAVLALDEPHRSTLLLRYFEGLSPEAIAARSGAPLATVTSRITRAHARLRERLREEDPRAGGLAWLAPIVVHRPPSDSSPWIGVLWMTTTTKFLLGAALLATALGAWFLLRERDAAAETALASASVSAAEAPASPESAAESAAAEGDRTAVASAPAASPAAAPAAPAPTAQFGRIHGRVVRPDGRPAAGRRVRMIRASLGPEKYATADEQGLFEQGELPPGTWSLSTWPDDKELAELGKSGENTLGGFAFLVQQTVELAAGADAEVVLGERPATAVEVRGRLLRGGVAVDGFLSWLPEGKASMDRQRIAPASAEKGFEALLDAPGRYLVIASGAEARAELTVDVPALERFDRDIALPGASLAGRVVRGDGSPVAGARVELTPRAGVRPRHPASNITFARTTREDGAFSFEDLAAGRFGVAVHAEKDATFGARALGELEVAADQAVEDVELTVEDGAVVAGRVLVPEGLPQTSNVFVFDAAGEPLNPVGPVVTGKDGKFRLFPLAPGVYRALAAHGNHWSPVARFEVRGGEDEAPLELALAEGALLSVDVEGRGEVFVDLRDGDGNCLSPLLDRHAFSRGLTNDWSTSSFVFRVPPGEYRVIARGLSGEAAEQRVRALAGERLAVDLSRR